MVVKEGEKKGKIKIWEKKIKSDERGGKIEGRREEG